MNSTKNKSTNKIMLLLVTKKAKTKRKGKKKQLPTTQN